MENLDSVKFTSPNFSDPYIVIAFVWEIMACIFNGAVIARALNGWLINPKITRQVIFASALAIIWISICLIQFFVQHRSLSIINNWTGYPLTLLIALQHIELLKLFVSLSDYWTKRKCRVFQLIIIALHVVISSPEYIWPFGLENNATVMEVSQSKRSWLEFAQYLGYLFSLYVIIFVLQCPFV